MPNATTDGREDADQVASTRAFQFIQRELHARIVPSGRRLGLVVGIDSYVDDDIADLRAAVADARAMHAVMVDPACGRFDPDLTVVLTDGQATQRAVSRELERLEKSATSADEVWIFFAGHALVLGDEHRLLPVDAERAHLRSSSIPFSTNAREIRCRRRVVFLDCCHAGATDASTRHVHQVEDVFKSYNADGTITFCSSDGSQQSVELPEGRGAFTYWLERGMRGEADTDGNGVVGSDELWEYVCRNVERDTLARTGIRQTPRFKADTSGAFALSVNVHAVRRRVEAEEAEVARAREAQEQERAENETLRQLLGVEDHELTTEEVRAAIRHKQARTSEVAQDILAEIRTFSRDGDARRAVRSIRRILRDVSLAQVPTSVVQPGEGHGRAAEERTSDARERDMAAAQEAARAQEVARAEEAARVEAEAAQQHAKAAEEQVAREAAEREAVRAAEQETHERELAVAAEEAARVEAEAAQQRAKAAEGQAAHVAHIDALRMRATDGDAAAMLELAAILEEGRGVPRDLENASYWYRRAERYGGQRSKRVYTGASVRANRPISQTITDELKHVADDRVFVYPKIPPGKLAAALASIARGVPAEDVLVVYDDTAFGSAKNGFVLTKDAIYWRSLLEVARARKYANIASVEVKEGRKTILLDGAAVDMHSCKSDAIAVVAAVLDQLRQRPAR